MPTKLTEFKEHCQLETQQRLDNKQQHSGIEQKDEPNKNYLRYLFSKRQKRNNHHDYTRDPTKAVFLILTTTLLFTFFNQALQFIY
jgi:hypothetical protein